MIRFEKFILTVLAIISLMTFVFVPSAGAQTTSPDENGWHVSFSPYLWFAGIHGTVGALNSQASVHAGFE